MHVAAHVDALQVWNAPRHILEASGATTQLNNDGHQEQFSPSVHASQDWKADPRQ